MARFIQLLLVAALAISCTLAQENTGTNYNTGDSGRSEQVNPDGSVQGQYSYTDPNGKLITVKYRAGKDGFQVEGDHLPKAPVPQAPAPQPQQYNQYNQQPQQQYNQQPQQQYNQQPQQQYNQQPQQQYNQQQQSNQLPASTFFSNNNGQQGGFPQQQFNNQYQHPNSIPQPQQFNNNPGFFNNGPQQQYNNNGNSNGGRGSKVSVSQQPGQGFSYTYESS